MEAPEKSLEDPGITRKDDPNPKIPLSTLKVVAPRGQWPARAAMLIRSLQMPQEKAGALTWGSQGKGGLVPARKQVAQNCLELKAVFLALRKFQDLCSHKMVLIATDNTTVVAYINKEEGP